MSDNDLTRHEGLLMRVPRRIRPEMKKTKQFDEELKTMVQVEIEATSGQLEKVRQAVQSAGTMNIELETVSDSTTKSLVKDVQHLKMEKAALMLDINLSQVQLSETSKKMEVLVETENYH